MDSELYYSLCLAIPNLRGTNSFYRIADYNPDYREFSQAKYEYSSETPLQISSSKEEGNAYKVEIRKWFPIDEKNRCHSMKNYAMDISMRWCFQKN